MQTCRQHTTKGLTSTLTETMTISPILVGVLCITPLLYRLIYHVTKLLLDISHYSAHSDSHAAPRGCRRLGLPAKQSNLRDEFDAKYSTSQPSKDEWRIKALFAYPIKSCAGVELDVADVVGTGLAYDRQFCFAELVADDANNPAKEKWELRTLRNGRFSRLALIAPEIWIPDPSAEDYAVDLDEVKSGGVLVIRYPRVIPKKLGSLSSAVITAGVAMGWLPRQSSFRVPLRPPSDQDRYPSVPVKLWKDFPLAFDYGKHLPDGLKAFLAGDAETDHRPFTLFRTNPAHSRKIYRCAPRETELGFQAHTAFADAYPLHLLSLASVQDVARQCAHAIPRLSIRRFRANVVIQGPPAYAEDAWKKICIGEHTVIHTVCRTVRCRLPNVDPDTGIRHPAEPDRTLKSFRCIDAGDRNNACLGMQLVPAVESMYRKEKKMVTR